MSRILLEKQKKIHVHLAIAPQGCYNAKVAAMPRTPVSTERSGEMKKESYVSPELKIRVLCRDGVLTDIIKSSTELPIDEF